MTSDGGSGRLRDAWAFGDFRVLATAFLVTMLGGSVASLAMTVLVFESTGSSLLASLTFTAMFLPYLVSGTLFSSVADRWPKRRLLVLGNLLSAATIAVMSLPVAPVGARLGLLTVLGVISPITAGASNTLVARVLPPTAYVPGRAVMRVIAQGAQVFGAAVGGVLLVVLSPTGVLLADAAGYLGAALLIAARLRSGTEADDPASEGDAERPGLLRDSWRGIGEVLSVRPVRAGLLLAWAVPFAIVAPEALGAPYISQQGLPSAAVGAWFVAMPLGTLVGALLGVWVLDAHARRRWLRPFAIAEPALLALILLRPPVAVAWLLLLLCGLLSVYGLGLDQYLLDATPAPVLTRMFTLLSTGLMTVQGLGFAVWGALGEVVPSVAVIGAAGVLGSAAAIAIRLPRLIHEPVVEAPA